MVKIGHKMVNVVFECPLMANKCIEINYVFFFLHSLALKDANFEPQSKDLTSRIMVAVSPVIKDDHMGSKNRQKLVHSAAHFLGTLTGTVRPPSIWKLKEFTELYACLNHLKLEPNDHR